MRCVVCPGVCVPLFFLQAMIHNIVCFHNVQVESIVLSIISMLSSPNDESPANIEAAVSALDIILLFAYEIYIVMIPVQL